MRIDAHRFDDFHQFTAALSLVVVLALLVAVGACARADLGPLPQSVAKVTTHGGICQPAQPYTTVFFRYAADGVASTASSPQSVVTLVCPIITYVADPISKYSYSVLEIRLTYIDAADDPAAYFHCIPWRTLVDRSTLRGRDLYTCEAEEGCTSPTSDSKRTGQLVWHYPFGTNEKERYRDMGIICQVPGPSPDLSWVGAIAATTVVRQ
jgi:hypothetical protein